MTQVNPCSSACIRGEEVEQKADISGKLLFPSGICYAAMRKPGLLLAILTVLTAGGCSASKPLDREQARSELRNAISLASETEMFLGYVRAGRATPHYVEGHSLYLEKQVAQSQRDLAHPASDVADAARECSSQLAGLGKELSRIAVHKNDPAALDKATQRVAQIRTRLEQAASSL